jgi:hypothetical protein
MTPEQALAYLQTVADDRDVSQTWLHINQTVQIVRQRIAALEQMLEDAMKNEDAMRQRVTALEQMLENVL